MARVLVIGGTLFIGRAMVEQLLDRGDEVVIMHRSEGTPFGDRVGEILCDRNDVAAVREALAGVRFDLVFDNVYDFEHGTSGEQVKAAAAALDVSGRYVFMSSMAAYGHGLGFGEEAPLVASDYPNPYAAQKADSERALFRLHDEEGLPVATLRPCFVYGPGNPYPRETFFWDRLLAGRPIIVPEDGQTPMQWVHAEDVARTALRAAEVDAAAGRAYNVAGDPTLTHVEYVQLLADVAGVDAELVHVPRARIQEAGGGLMAPPFYFGVYLDVPPLTVKTDRVPSELGVELRPLEEGLRETYRWYQAQEPATPDFSWEDKLLAAAR